MTYYSISFLSDVDMLQLSQRTGLRLPIEFMGQLLNFHIINTESQNHRITESQNHRITEW